MAHARIQQKLASARRLDWAVAVIHGLLRFVCGAAVVALILFLVDYQLYRMPGPMRMVAWACVVGVLGYCLVRFVIRPAVRERSDDALALRVESVYPSLAGRLIASVQLGRQMDRWYRRGVARIVEALHVQTESAVRPLRFSIITPRRPLVRAAGFTAAVGGLCAAALLYQAAAVRTFGDRMLFGEGMYPSRTKVLEVRPGDASNPLAVLRGSAVDFSVRFGGWRVPGDATLELMDDHQRTTEIPMRPEGEGRFTATVARAVESFTYRVRGGDAVAERDPSGRAYRVNVRLRPVATVKLRLAYPTYTSKEPAIIEGGVAQAIEGTLVRILGRCSKDISEIKLVYLSGPDAGRAVPMKLTSARSARLDLAGPLDSSFRYTVRVTDTDGVANYEAVDSEESPAPIYAIRVVRDARPRVTVTEPKTESAEVRDDGEMAIRARATDDYGLVGATLHWRLAREDYERTDADDRWRTKPLYRVGAGAAPQGLEALACRIVPRELNAVAGDSIVFFVAAHDHTAPAAVAAGLGDGESPPRGVGRSKQYTIVVIDEKTFRLRLKKQLE